MTIRSIEPVMTVISGHWAVSCKSAVAVATLVFVALAGMPVVPAIAQTTYIPMSTSNNGSRTVDSDTSVAQKFHTGNWNHGYTISTVRVRHSRVDFAGTGSLTMSVWNSDSSGLPGNELFQFDNPRGWRSSGTITFTANTHGALSANTDYFVVWEYNGSGSVTLHQRTHTHPTISGIDDWEIPQRSRRANSRGEWPSSRIDATRFIQLEINGMEAPDPNRQFAASGVPIITGDWGVGKTLTASTANIGDANGLEGVVFRYLWYSYRSDDLMSETLLSSGVEAGSVMDDTVAGATAAEGGDKFVLQGSDVGRKIRVRVSFMDQRSNNEVVWSDYYPGGTDAGIVIGGENRASSGYPEIEYVLDTSFRAGARLLASKGSIDDLNGASVPILRCQWERGPGTWTEIAGASSCSYTLQSADVSTGRKVRVVVTFRDDDGHTETRASAAFPYAQFSILAPDTDSVREDEAGGASLAFTVRLSETTEHDATVIFDRRMNSKASDSDFTEPVRRTLVFPAGNGERSQTVTLDIVNDNIYEGRPLRGVILERLAVELTLPTSNVAVIDSSMSQAIAFIENDDPLPVISIEGPESSIDEGDEMTFTVTLDGVSEATSFVNWNIVEDSDTQVEFAGSENDFITSTEVQGILTFSPEDPITATVTRNIVFRTNDDAIEEGPESVKVMISNQTNAALGRTTAIGTINASDGTPTLTISRMTVNEGDSTQFTVSLQPHHNEEVRVDYSVSAGSGVHQTEASDFDSTNGLRSGQTLVFAANDTEKQILVETVEDETVEPSETFEITLSNIQVATEGSVVFASGSGAEIATGTIIDNDFPEISIDPISLMEGESIEYTVAMDRPSWQDIDVSYVFENGTALLANNDFTDVPSDNTVTIQAGSISATLMIEARADNVDEADETFTVRLSNISPSNAAHFPSMHVTTAAEITIVDSNVPELSIVAGTGDAAGQADEGDSMTFAVQTDIASYRDLTVGYVITKEAGDGADVAGANSDVDHTPNPVTIDAGQQETTITVSTREDDIDELEETFTLSLLSTSILPAGAATIATGNGGSTKGTIIDDDDAPSVTVGFESPSTSMVVEGADLVLTASLSHASSREIRVPYVLGGGASTADITDDYTDATVHGSAVGSPLIFEAGQTSKTITITTLDDDVKEESETVVVSLSPPQGSDSMVDANLATVGTPGSATGTIADDTDPPVMTLEVTPNAVIEGSSVTVRVRITNDKTFSTDQAINLAFSGPPSGAATLETDYTIGGAGTGPSYAITLTAGATLAEAAIMAVDDLDLTEGDEIVLIDATHDGTTVGSQQTLTISEKPVSEFEVVLSTSTISEAGETATVTVNITNSVTFDSQQTISLTFGGTASSGPGMDYTVSGTSVTLAASQTTSSSVTITALEDDIFEPGGETVLVNATHSGSPIGMEVTLAIADNDAEPALVLELSSPSIAEDGGNATVTVRSSNSKTYSTAQTINFSFSSSTATVEDDYTLTDFGSSPTYSLSLVAETASVSGTVTAVDDDIDEEPSETIQISATRMVAGNPPVGTTQTLTIIDDDDAPELTITAGTAVSEGSPATFTVSLNRRSSRSITVQYSLTGGAASGLATAGSDFTNPAQSTDREVILAALSDRSTFTVATIDDAMDEPPETFTATLVPTTISPLGAATVASGSGGTATATINDNDLPLVTVSGASPIEEGDNAVFVLEREGVLAGTLAVSFTIIPQGNYVDSGHTLQTSATFLADSSMISVSVPTDDDTTYESNGSFTLTLVDGGSIYNEGSPPSTATIVVNDNEASPVLSISASSTAVTEGGTLSFVVALTPAVAETVTVSYSTGGGTSTAAASSDYTAIPSTTLTFTTGQTSKTIVVTTIDDATDEPDETVRVALSSPMGSFASIASGMGEAYGRISDNDVPELSVQSATADEGMTLMFNVGLTIASYQDITVTYTLASGSATLTSDYSDAGSGSLSIDAGDTTGMITVNSVDDDVDEVNETFELTITAVAPEGAVILPTAAVTGTITDNDDAPVVSVATPNPASVTEGADLAFTVSLTRTSSRTITVDYALSGSASVNIDYRDDGSSSTITFMPGDNSKTITLTTLADMRDEDTESVVVMLENQLPASAAAISGTAASAAGSIIDNNTPEFSIADAHATEGGTVRFTVEKDIVSYQTITLMWRVTADTAVAGTDYEDTPANTGGMLTFSADEREQHIVVSTIQNNDADGSRTFNVSLSNISPSTAAVFADATAIGTIDDDEAPSLSVASVTAEEGETMTFMVNLRPTSDQNVTVMYTVSVGSGGDGATAADLASGALRTATLNFPAGTSVRTFTVATEDDGLDEPDETFTVRLSSPTGGAELSGGSVASGTITDNDTPALSFERLEEEAAEGSSVEFTVNLSIASYRPISVGYLLAGGTVAGAATIDDDFTNPGQSARMITFTTGATSQTLVVAALTDNLDEPNETFTVTLNSVSIVDAAMLPAGSAATATGTILDGNVPELTLAVTSGSSVVEGHAISFTVESDIRSYRDIVVSYTLTGGNAAGLATASSDFEVPALTEVTVDAGTLSKTFTVNTTHDSIDEPNETFTVELGDVTPTGAATVASGSGTATVSITDNNDTPVLSISAPTPSSVAEGEDLEFTVRLSGASSQTITVDYELSGTATADDDYTDTGTGTTLTFDSGDTSITVTVRTLTDNTDEDTENVVVMLFNQGPSGAVTLSATAAAATGMIIDGNTPQFSIADAFAAEGSDIVFMVRKDIESFRSITVDWEVIAGTALAGTDYGSDSANTGGTLRFSATDRVQSFSVSTIDTNESEGPRSFTVTLSNISPAGAAAFLDNSAEGRIDDNETPTFSIAAASAAENEAVTFTVTLAPASSANVFVQYEVAAGTGSNAATAADFAPGTLRTDTLPFTAGATERMITVALEDDAVDEPEETFTVTLSNPVTGTALRGGGQILAVEGTISDNDTPALSFASDMVRASEGSPVSFTVRMTPVSYLDLEVGYSLEGGSAEGEATADIDFTIPETDDRVVTFAKGVAEQTVTVATSTDNLDEPDETFTIALDSVSIAGAASLPSNPEATGTIIDSNVPVLSLSADDPASEGSPVTFTVESDIPSFQDITVVYSLAGGSDVGEAIAGMDFEVPSQAQATIFAPSTSRKIAVTTIQDILDEPNETFTVGLESVTPSGAAVIAPGPNGRATGWINDDDLPLITVSALANTVPEGMPAVFSINRQDFAGDVLTVNFVIAESGSFRDLAQNLPTSVTFERNSNTALVSVATVDDMADELGGSLTLTISDGGTSYNEGTPASSATIIVEDNDETPELSIAPVAAVSEGTDLQFVVSMSTGAAEPITVRYLIGGDASTATAGVDYASAASGSLTFAVGETEKRIRIRTIDDKINESEKTVRVRLSSVQGGFVTINRSRNEVYGRILDNDTPELSIEQPVTLAEGTDTGIVVSTEVASFQDLAVSYQIFGGTAVLGEDFVQTGTGVFTILAGELSGAIPLSTIADDLDEEDETFQIALTGVIPQDAVEFQSVPVTVTIADGDDAPAVAIASPAPATVVEGNEMVFTVSLSRASSRAITVEYVIAGGEAVAGEDFVDETGDSQVLTFPPLSREAQIRLAILDDMLDEDDLETVTVTLLDPEPSGLAVKGAALALAYIQDGDVGAPMLGVERRSLSTVVEGEQIDFGVTMVPASILEVRVEFDVSGTAMLGSDYVCTVWEVNENGQEVADSSSTCPEPEVQGGQTPAAEQSGESAVAARSLIGGENLNDVPEVSPAQTRHGVLVFDAGEREKIIRMATVEDSNESELIEDVVITLRNPAGGRPFGEPPELDPEATMASAQIGVYSLADQLTKGTRAMLLRHAGRFQSVTSNAALSRLRGDWRGQYYAEGVDGVDEALASIRLGEEGQEWGWSNWATMSYSSIEGAAAGDAYDAYIGLDRVLVPGRQVLGFLVGYETGDLEIEEAEYSTSLVQFGFYGATRLGSGVIFDGAVAVGAAEPAVSEGDIEAEVESQRITARADLSGDLGWRIGGIGITPVAGVLYAVETLEGLVEFDNGLKTLSLTRANIGASVHGTIGKVRYELRPQMNQNSERTGEETSSSSSGSVSGRVQMHLGGGAALEIDGMVDGLGMTDVYESHSLGLRLAFRLWPSLSDNGEATDGSASF